MTSGSLCTTQRPARAHRSIMSSKTKCKLCGKEVFLMEQLKLPKGDLLHRYASHPLSLDLTSMQQLLQVHHLRWFP